MKKLILAAFAAFSILAVTVAPAATLEVEGSPYPDDYARPGALHLHTDLTLTPTDFTSTGGWFVVEIVGDVDDVTEVFVLQSNYSVAGRTTVSAGENEFWIKVKDRFSKGMPKIFTLASVIKRDPTGNSRSVGLILKEFYTDTHGRVNLSGSFAETGFYTIDEEVLDAGEIHIENESAGVKLTTWNTRTASWAGLITSTYDDEIYVYNSRFVLDTNLHGNPGASGGIVRHNSVPRKSVPALVDDGQTLYRFPGAVIPIWGPGLVQFEVIPGKKLRGSSYSVSLQTEELVIWNGTLQMFMPPPRGDEIVGPTVVVR